MSRKKVHDKEFEIYAQLEEADRENLHQLRNLQIQSIQGNTVPLGTAIERKLLDLPIFVYP